MIDFLIMYEHRNREINSACLIKAELERRGYTALIENSVNRQYFRYHFSCKPKVILVVSLYNENIFHGHVTDMIGYCKKVVNFQWEQIGDIKSRGKLLIPKGICKTAVHLCWNENRADFLRKNGVRNAIEVGPIQMDFLKPEFSDFYKSKSAIREEYNVTQSNFLLYISSFTYVHMSKDDEERLADMTGIDIRSRIDEAEKSQNETLEVLKRYALEHKNIAVIYRPHPGEKISPVLNELCNEIPNFYVISDYSIQQWIQISDVIVSWISTSVSEIYFAGKKCVILQPVEVTAWEDVLYKGARIARTYEQLIDEIENDSMPFPIDEKLIIDNYGSKSAEFAYNKIVDLLEEIYKTDSYDMMDYPKKPYMQAPIKRCIKSLIDTMHITEDTFPFSRIRKCKDWLRFYSDYKKKTDLDYVTDKEIIEITERIKEIINKL